MDLKHRLSRYDNFSLEKAVAMMRRVESDLKANRYQNALIPASRQTHQNGASFGINHLF